MKSAAIVGVIVVAGVLAGIFLLVMNARLDFPKGPIADTDGYGYNLCTDADAGTKDLKGFGYFGDVKGDTRARGEVFSTTRVWYSWFHDGESRPVVVEARTENCPAIGIDFYPDRAHYIFSYSTDGANWVPFYQDRIPNARATVTLPGTGIGPTGAFNLIIDGFEYCRVPTTNGCPNGQSVNITEGAALKVDVYVSRVAFPSWPGNPETNGLKIASDQVELKNALSYVSWGANAYKIGETAIVRWTIPTTQDENGNYSYFLTVLDENTDLPIAGFDRKPLTTTTGNFQIPITSSMFSNVLATCQNRLRAEVLTQLIVANLQDTAIQAPVSIGGVPPVVTQLSLDKAEYFEGDTAMVKWSTSGNVTKVHVTAHVSGLIVYDQDVDASKKSVDFRVPRTGILVVEVTAYNLCQPSEVKRIVATVGDVYPGLCVVYPDLPQCGVKNLVKLIIAVLAVVAVILAFILLAFLLAREGLPFPPIVGILIAIVVTGVLAIVFASQGVFDPLLGVGA